ncbi:hypothetical protein KL86DES1_22119 [uncultured Desulfovibrio sp.]|uniref:Uncharacterized protein n=1 Tax=uncultured Desulfovibrio sp. TaxID=167968 RepID=A0A212LB59_9BACT|nr:hypothetical protein KL86DES1_21356 [uncultured Desulfovibrio sp.]SCM74730.1 hypothetical protein KL86DES1_22119 [uncultured Desulfovibrio sp.]VZH35013.1 conserved protein of unknown function [Desulfovibrio sp. 86]
MVNRATSLLMVVANRIFRLNEHFEMLLISKLICSRRLTAFGRDPFLSLQADRNTDMPRKAS